MPYWIMIQRNGERNPLYSVNTLNEAKKEIEKQVSAWKAQGMKVPDYFVFYGKELVFSTIK